MESNFLVECFSRLLLRNLHNIKWGERRIVKTQTRENQFQSVFKKPREHSSTPSSPQNLPPVHPSKILYYSTPAFSPGKDKTAHRKTPQIDQHPIFLTIFHRACLMPIQERPSRPRAQRPLVRGRYVEVGWKTGFAADTYHDAGPIELRIIFARGAGFCFRPVDSSSVERGGLVGIVGGREGGGFQKIFSLEKREVTRKERDFLLGEKNMIKVERIFFRGLGLGWVSFS